MVSLRRVGFEKIIRGIPIRGKEEAKNILKRLLEVRQSFSGLRPSSVSSQAERIHSEICATLDAYGHYKGYFTDEGLGTLFYNSKLSVSSLDDAHQTYVLKIDIPYKEEDTLELFTANFLRIDRALQSIKIPLNFWPFLPSFQMDFRQLAGMFPPLPGFSVYPLNAQAALDRFKFDKSCVLAQDGRFKIKVNLKGVNVFERVSMQRDKFFAPYIINQQTNQGCRMLFEDPVVVLSLVGKQDYIIDNAQRMEADEIAGQIRQHLLKFVRPREDVTGDILPISFDEFLINPFDPRQLSDDVLICQLFRKLLFLAEDNEIASIPERLDLIKAKMREIVEIWEHRGYMVGITKDESQPNVAELCAKEIRSEVGRITNSLWTDPAEKSVHKRKLTTRVKPIRVMT